MGAQLARTQRDYRPQNSEDFGKYTITNNQSFLRASFHRESFFQKELSKIDQNVEEEDQQYEQSQVQQSKEKKKNFWQVLLCTKQIQEDKDLEEQHPVRRFKPFNKRVKANDFTVLCILGRSKLAEVYLTQLKQNSGQKDDYFALKKIDKSYVKKKQIAQHLETEKTILKLSQSPFLNQMICTFRDQHSYYILMEWAKGADVYSFIRPEGQRIHQFKQAGQQAIRFILGCTILGLEYLHKKNIVYGALKPQNLLIFQDGYIKLTNFTQSKQLYEGIKYYPVAGTIPYFAPEMVMGQSCTLAIDFWMLGILIYELINQEPPFSIKQIIMGDHEKKKTFRNIAKEKEGNYFPQYSSVSEELQNLVECLLKAHRKQRLCNWKEIKNHGFFKKVKFDWKKLYKKQLPSPLQPIISQKLTYEQLQQNVRAPFKQNHIKEEYFWTVGSWSQQCKDFY